MQTPYKSLAAKLIVEDILGKDGWAGKVRFTSSGSEANEEALIIAKLYTGKPFIISREFSYHDWTLGAAPAQPLDGGAALWLTVEASIGRLLVSQPKVSL